jgi:hypothetical protein
MSTTPTEPEGTDRPAAPTGYTIGARGDLARLPVPGNAELLVVVLSAILLALLAWVADGIRDTAWFTSFTAIVVAYLISRGIAKASRVLEH